MQQCLVFAISQFRFLVPIIQFPTINWVISFQGNYFIFQIDQDRLNIIINDSHIAQVRTFQFVDLNNRCHIKLRILHVYLRFIQIKNIVTISMGLTLIIKKKIQVFFCNFRDTKQFQVFRFVLILQMLSNNQLLCLNCKDRATFTIKNHEKQDSFICFKIRLQCRCSISQIYLIHLKYFIATDYQIRSQIWRTLYFLLNRQVYLLRISYTFKVIYRLPQRFYFMTHSSQSLIILENCLRENYYLLEFL